MGPRFISAEGPCAARGDKMNSQLQWDRASLARKAAALARLAFGGSCAAFGEREPPAAARGRADCRRACGKCWIVKEHEHGRHLPSPPSHSRRQTSDQSMAAINPNPRCRPAPSASGPATACLKYTAAPKTV